MDLQIVSGEPRVQDIRLAESLEFARPAKIRELIERNIEELRRYGEVIPVAGKTLPQGGRPSTEYYLNEEQALLICMKSDAPQPEGDFALIDCRSRRSRGAAVVTRASKQLPTECMFYFGGPE